MVSEEIFAGHTVQRFDDEDRRSRGQLSKKYGLASSVWTKDHALCGSPVA